jgi:hypothetical protein
VTGVAPPLAVAALRKTVLADTLKVCTLVELLKMPAPLTTKMSLMLTV